MASSCVLLAVVVIAVAPHGCSALADQWGACSATVSSDKWGVCMDADLNNVNNACCTEIKASQSGTPPSIDTFCSACKNQGKGFAHYEINMICAPNQTQGVLLNAILLGTENVGNAQGPLTLKAGTCEAKSTDCTSKLGLAGRTLLGGSGDIVWRSVTSSCCTPLNKFLKNIWDSEALTDMCNECNATKNAAVQMLYHDGFACAGGFPSVVV